VGVVLVVVVVALAVFGADPTPHCDRSTSRLLVLDEANARTREKWMLGRSFVPALRAPANSVVFDVRSFLGEERSRAQ
jgi:hypothetical protein